jgi:hypothetical protein
VSAHGQLLEIARDEPLSSIGAATMPCFLLHTAPAEAQAISGINIDVCRCEKKTPLFLASIFPTVFFPEMPFEKRKARHSALGCHRNLCNATNRTGSAWPRTILIQADGRT